MTCELLKKSILLCAVMITTLSTSAVAAEKVELSAEEDYIQAETAEENIQITELSDYQLFDDEALEEEVLIPETDMIANDASIATEEEQLFSEEVSFADPAESVSLVGNEEGLEIPESISFIPAKEPVEYEGVYSNIELDESENEYQYYMTTFHMNSAVGNTLIVNYADGRSISYMLEHNGDSSDEWFYVNIDDASDAINWDEVNIYDDQETNHWTVGDNNPIYISFRDTSCVIYATILENPVKSTAYYPSHEIVLNENSVGSIQTDDAGEEYYFYHIDYFYEDDLFEVTMKDGSVKNYYFTWDNDGVFVNDKDSSDILHLYVRDYQHETHWTVGGDNQYGLEYFGVVCYVPVTIQVNPVKSIAFMPAEGLYAYEGMSGYYATDSNGEIYYHYSMNFNDSELLVSKADGEEVTYKFNWTQKENGDWHAFWINETDESDVIDGDEVWYYHDQNEKHWQVGHTYDVRLEYSGRNCTVPYRIMENPVESIEYTPKSNIVYEDELWSIEKDDEGNPYKMQKFLFRYGDLFTIHYTDGTKETFEIRPYVYENGVEDFAFFNTETGQRGLKNYISENDFDDRDNWSANNTYTAEIEYMNRKATFSVTLLSGSHEHNWSIETVKKEATCQEDGLVELKCICGAVKTESSRKKDHSWNKEYTVDKQATSTTDGQESIHCAVCGAIMPGSVRVINKTGGPTAGKQTPPGSTAVQTKAAQPMTVKAKAPSVKASKLGKKKQTITKGKAFTIKKAQGEISFKKRSGSKNLSISKAGKITVKKGTKKGTYKIKVIVTASGNDKYEAGSKTVTVKVKVK